ncbi:MAG: hypothetical protein RM338_21610 [Nostoc sp. DedQUE12a]|nr:hypothetical protein [Nostoc sp. DedQUE12a]
MKHRTKFLIWWLSLLRGHQSPTEVKTSSIAAFCLLPPLFNPGAVEVVKLAELTGQSITTILAQVLPINLLASVTALIVFWILPSTLAGITGSGSATAIAVMNVLVPIAAKINLEPVKVGTLVSVAAQLDAP